MQIPIIISLFVLTLTTGCRQKSDYKDLMEARVLIFLAITINDTEFAREYRASQSDYYPHVNGELLAKELRRSEKFLANIEPFTIDEHLGILDASGHPLGIEIYPIGTKDEPLISIWTVGNNRIDEMGLGDDNGWTLYFDGKFRRITPNSRNK